MFVWFFSPVVSLVFMEEWSEKAEKIQSALWTILLSVLKSTWRRKYLWNQLISLPFPSLKSVSLLKFIHHQHFTALHCLAFCLLLLSFFLLTISKNYLNEQNSLFALPLRMKNLVKQRKATHLMPFHLFTEQTLIWILKFIVRGSGRFWEIYLLAKLENANLSALVKHEKGVCEMNHFQSVWNCCEWFELFNSFKNYWSLEISCNGQLRVWIEGRSGREK